MYYEALSHMPPGERQGSDSEFKPNLVNTVCYLVQVRRGRAHRPCRCWRLATALAAHLMGWRSKGRSLCCCGTSVDRAAVVASAA
jgi:hypothetical protein